MKKISLKDLNFNGIEQLSREELKKVLGGFDGGYGDYGDYGGYEGGDSCCLHEYWTEGPIFQETCGISQESADYACRTRKEEQLGYSCHVSCS